MTASQELAAALIRSLFCGLPRQEKRVAVFQAASDESDGGHHRSVFWHAGFLAPESDWSVYFAPAWQEQVLDREPVIPFLHMTELRDSEWQRKYGLGETDVQDKLDAAFAVIRQVGSLAPIGVKTNAGVFLDAFGKKKNLKTPNSTKPKRFLVDHLCFMVYAFAVTMWAHDEYPDAEKIDFVVARKDGVFDMNKEFYDTIGEAFDAMGKPGLVNLIGEILPGSKDRVPLQAADVLCWYSSRYPLGVLSERDHCRYGTLAKRRGFKFEWDDEMLRQLAQAFKDRLNEAE